MTMTSKITQKMCQCTLVAAVLQGSDMHKKSQVGWLHNMYRKKNKAA